MARTPMNNSGGARSRGSLPAPAVPPILQNLMAAQPMPPASMPGTGLAGAMSATRRMPPAEQTSYAQLPSYQMGGAIGPGGMPQRPPVCRHSLPLVCNSRRTRRNRSHHK
jgi:hypothetical protein